MSLAVVVVLLMDRTLSVRANNGIVAEVGNNDEGPCPTEGSVLEMSPSIVNGEATLILGGRTKSKTLVQGFEARAGSCVAHWTAFVRKFKYKLSAG